MPDLPITVRLSPLDNTVVARVDILPGTELAGEGWRTAQRIPAGHKVATRPIAKGEPIRKFDQIIGFATTDIAPGEHVHVHNCGMRDFARDYAVGSDVRPTSRWCPRRSARSFQRLSCAANGKVGTRNYIGILSTVNCSASRLEVHRRALPARGAGAVPERRRRRRHHPRHRLRHGRPRRGLRHPAAHALGLRRRTRTSPRS